MKKGKRMREEMDERREKLGKKQTNNGSPIFIRSRLEQIKE